MIEKDKITLLGDWIGTTPCSKVLAIATNVDVVTTTVAALFAMVAESILNPACSLSSLAGAASNPLFTGLLFRAVTYRNLAASGYSFEKIQRFVINKKPSEITGASFVETIAFAYAAEKTTLRTLKLTGAIVLFTCGFLTLNGIQGLCQIFVP